MKNSIEIKELFHRIIISLLLLLIKVVTLYSYWMIFYLPKGRGGEIEKVLLPTFENQGQY
ncbi:hypothetical protein A9Q99_18125 [Gammaproteobacteria bacterium 45_16_T64]|nr:hypothetical protein A9Q99_18125 [Gammaproteobacteria bacterium 45_16_T64]